MAYFTRLIGANRVAGLVTLSVVGGMITIGQALLSVSGVETNEWLILSGLGIGGLILGIVAAEVFRLVVLNPYSTAYDTKRTVYLSLFGGLALSGFGTIFITSVARSNPHVDWRLSFALSVVLGTPLMIICLEQFILRVGGQSSSSLSAEEFESMMDDEEFESDFDGSTLKED